ncbi:polyketide synthase dehydratase domain-containing protein, partial [Streptomyces sp. B1866]|uniref:4'-phosphopantetheinyl transferase superfamily protein n=1 Tax=Streptomyces sp. B1866 TaxID=3075431 RepID=UPI002890B28F
GAAPAPAVAGLPGAGVPGAGLPGAGGIGALSGLAERYPAAAELGALLEETAHTAASLMLAARGGAVSPAPAAPVPVRPVPPVRPPAPPAPAAAPAVPAGPGPAAPGSTLRVSVETMPYLADHCFIPQRPGWPDVADRRPVVPATTVVQHMADATERAAPGLRAVAVHDVRLNQWVAATPAHDVAVTATPEGPGTYAVDFGAFAGSRVELAPAHPEPPAPWPVDPAAERRPDHTAEQLYTDRWMFHGPRFQGVTELTAIGAAHVRGTITAPEAPGALLDNVGQILGYWLMSRYTERTIVFPVRMGAFRFYGPHPAPGTPVHCHIRITSVTDTALVCDADLTVEGRVWARITDWEDRRFLGLDARLDGGYPDRRGLSEPRADGWNLLRDAWPDLASRDLIIRTNLGADERAEYDRRPPRGRRQWLLGRIAAKDAVRRWLWEQGEGPVFPAEIAIGNDASGRPYPTGTHGRTLPPLDLSIAHSGEVAVALVRPGDEGRPGPGAGIDVEEVTPRDEATLAAALGEEERALLAARCRADGRPREEWFTRFWAAKEAAAKAEGTGLLGRPRDFAVIEAGEPAAGGPGAGAPAAGDPAAGETEVLVATRQGVHRVRAAPVTHNSRTYVVAWTAAPHTESTRTEESST